MSNHTINRIALTVLMQLHPQLNPIERVLKADRIPNEIMEYFFFSKILKDKFSIYSFADQYNAWHESIDKKFSNLSNIKDEFDLIFGYQEILQESLRTPYLGANKNKVFDDMERFKDPRNPEQTQMISFISNRYLQCINVQKDLETSIKKDFPKSTAWAVVLLQLLYSEDITKVQVKQLPLDFIAKLNKTKDLIDQDIADEYLKHTGQNISTLFSKIETKFKYDALNENITEVQPKEDNWFEGIKNKIRKKI